MVCSSAAKRSSSNKYVCKYIGRINDQSNWSGPFSLVVMTLDYRSRNTWFDPRSGTRREYFLYRSISPPTCINPLVKPRFTCPKNCRFSFFSKTLSYVVDTNEYHNICFL